jgi:histone H3/H4
MPGTISVYLAPVDMRPYSQMARSKHTSNNPGGKAAGLHPNVDVKLDKKLPVESQVKVEKKPRKKTRFKQSTTAIRQIRKQQKETGSLFNKAATRRILLECIRNVSSERNVNYRISKACVTGLCDYITSFSVDLLAEAGNEAIKEGKSTLKPHHLNEAVRLHVTQLTMGARPYEIPFETKKIRESELKEITLKQKEANKQIRALRAEQAGKKVEPVGFFKTKQVDDNELPEDTGSDTDPELLS